MQARELFRSSLNIREKVLGPEHPEVAQTLGNLAIVLSAQVRTVECLPLDHFILLHQAGVKRACVSNFLILHGRLHTL